MNSIAKPPRRSLGTLIGGAAYGRAFRRIEPALDADAAKYLAAVEAADQQVLEDGVKRAVSKFVRACKTDGNWDAVKASCILCGARTLAGALVPLKGAAPTNYNFVGLGTDYSRTAGLTGDGSTKYLDSGRDNDDDPQNGRHLSVFATALNDEDTARSYIRAVFAGGTGGSQIFSAVSASKLLFRLADSTTQTSSANLHSTAGFLGISRSSSSSYSARGSGTGESIATASETPGSGNFFVFAGNNVATSNIDLYSNATLAFYSIGEAVDLALLDTAVSTLVSEIGAAV